jgi:hypothetical protein
MGDKLFQEYFVRSMKQIVGYQNLITEMLADMEDAEKREYFRNKYIALLEQLKQK